MTHFTKANLRIVVALLLATGTFERAALHAQGLTAQLYGTVQDPSGNVVPNARLRLTNAGTGQTRERSSDHLGNIVFTDLLPGRYDLKIECSGFKTYEKRDIVVTATERVVLRDIVLQLGEISQTVSVTAEAARLQTQSAERSGLITVTQMQELSLKGRDYLGMLRLLPGVVDTRNREAPGWNNLGGVNINGVRSGTINLTVDGVTNLDTGSAGGPWLAPGLDAIAEVKVLLTNYQAEYGRNSSATINAIIKNGTRQFHGGAFYFKRNEALNANEYFNNRDGLPKPRYRFEYPGYFLGGPVIIPKLTKSREKLFFFWSQEFLPRKYPTRQGRLTFPTALERAGDFSQSMDTNGAVIPILDPLNNRQPFAGNRVPASRIDKNGQALLNVFPLPNTTDPSRTFNNVFQSTVDQPRREEILRIDWNAGPKTVFYSRWIGNHESFSGAYDFALASTIWPQLPIKYQIASNGLVNTLIHAFSPTLVNEATFGFTTALQTTQALNQEGLDRNDRRKLGANLPQFHPEINPLHLVPQATFGGVPSAPQLFIDNRFPWHARNTIVNFSDNLSKTWGAHAFKAGIYIERTERPIPKRGSVFNGSFDFGRNPNNPQDANYAFANAILGSVNAYSESDGSPPEGARFRNTEWFVQDNWRAHKRLTLDIGVRFYHIVPTYNTAGKVSFFRPEDYNPQTAALLIQPYRASATGPRSGRNPGTGEVVPEVKIGTFAPGTGALYSGMRVTDTGRVVETPSIQVAPRVGFAWNVFGDGKTAVRGGVGIFPDRFADGPTMQATGLPPLVNTPTAYFTTIRDLLASPLSLSPGNVNAYQGRFNSPTVYHWSFGIQRDIGFGTVLDVAYVGNGARHLLQRRNFNATPYGTNFRPSSIDPTLTGNRPLPPNLLRPIRGYADIFYYEMSSTSNYHSLQTQINRRFMRHLTFGATWTWSKALDLVDGSDGTVNPFMDSHMRHYGKAGFDRTHNFVFSYDYKLPELRGKAALARAVASGWEFSGITSFTSGAPLGLGYSFVQAVDITGAAGTGVDSRVNLTGDPNLPRSERTRDRAFRTEVVRPPDASNFGIGTAAKDLIRGPGINNWDISVFKNFPLAENDRRIQFRWEMYNAFNHTQFATLDGSGRFDAAGRQVNGRLGQYISARESRRMQVALKFYF